MKQKYEKLTPIQHVIKRPGMYVGDIETNLRKIFVVEDTTNFENIIIINKLVQYNPGFFKLFDEIITNASDHYIRTGKVKYIKVTVKPDHIIIENDGPGIPIEINKEHKIYIPEMIFGHLHSGSNFDDDDNRNWGGMNGLGSKLTNIYSKRFIVETADGKNKYVQEFSDNLSVIGKPKITKLRRQYTKITFYPDFEKFGIEEITPEIEQILMKRIIDISVYCPKVKIFYNKQEIPMKSFKDYMGMYLEPDSELFYERLNDDWEVGIAQAPEDVFQQVSMVNGISTIIGGTHVNHVTNQLVKGISETLEKKHKKIRIKTNDVKNKLFVFLNSKVVNPTFDTQTKENLTTRLISKHVSDVNVSDKLIKQLSQSDIVEDILNYIQLREKADLKKLNKGKTTKIKIRKLDDANMAGTAQSDKCMLFLAEGDCLCEETELIIIRNGNKINEKIKNVKIGDGVITHNSYIGIVQSISKKIKKPIKIKLKDGSTILCSKEHKWYVYDIVLDVFIFVRTKNLDMKKHKFIKNKNSFYKEILQIDEIINIEKEKYNLLFKIGTEEVLSSNKHLFSVYDIIENKFEMLEARNINKDKHCLVNYTKDILTPSVK